jgi:SRSO17 transposase
MIRYGGRRLACPMRSGLRLKPQIAITQFCEARQGGAPDGVVLADTGYGNDTAFRDTLSELGLQYAVGI